MATEIRAKNKLEKEEKILFIEKMCVHFGIHPEKQILKNLQYANRKEIIHHILKIKEKKSRKINYKEILAYRNEMQIGEKRSPSIKEIETKLELNQEDIIKLV